MGLSEGVLVEEQPSKNDNLGDMEEAKHDFPSDEEDSPVARICLRVIRRVQTQRKLRWSQQRMGQRETGEVCREFNDNSTTKHPNDE